MLKLNRTNLEGVLLKMKGQEVNAKNLSEAFGFKKEFKGFSIHAQQLGSDRECTIVSVPGDFNTVYVPTNNWVVK